jgi:hypothetical protein
MKLFTTNLVRCKSGQDISLHHLQKVLSARKEAGLPTSNYNQTIEHPLIGKRLRYNPTGVEYTVIRGKRQWYWGWYIGFIFEQDNGSGTFIHWEQDPNQPTCYDVIVTAIKENQEDFELLN